MILNAPHSVASVKGAQHTLLSPYCLVTLVLFPHFSGPSISFVYVSMMLCLGSICSNFSCMDFFFFLQGSFSQLNLDLSAFMGTLTTHPHHMLPLAPHLPLELNVQIVCSLVGPVRYIVNNCLLFWK